MKLSGRTALVTGGTSGIGRGIATALHKLNNQVIMCGRDRKELSKVEKELPGVAALPCDVGDSREREKLAADVLRRFPDLDILVNNAGIQRYIDLTKGYEELKSGEDEIAINLVGTVELTALFIGHLLKRPSAAIVNVSSGLGFMPMRSTPVYSATKAAVHTFSLVLREQLRDTAVRVVEVVPPMVDTNLNKEGRERAHLKYRGVGVSEYVPTIMKGLEKDADTVFYGEGASVMSEPRGESEVRLLKR